MERYKHANFGSTTKKVNRIWGDLRIHVRVKLRRFLDKQATKERAGFNWFRIAYEGRLS
jgi:hypothetical protein